MSDQQSLSNRFQQLSVEFYSYIVDSKNWGKTELGNYIIKPESKL